MNCSVVKNWKWKESQENMAGIDAVSCNWQPLLPSSLHPSPLVQSRICSAYNSAWQDNAFVPVILVAWMSSLWKKTVMAVVVPVLARVSGGLWVGLLSQVGSQPQSALLPSVAFLWVSTTSAHWLDCHIACICLPSLCVFFPGLKNWICFCSCLWTVLDDCLFLSS